MRTICGENIIVAEGEQNIDFSSIIHLNDSAAYLWNNIKGKDFNATDLTRLLLDEYDVEEALACKDVATLIESWRNAGLIDE